MSQDKGLGRRGGTEHGGNLRLRPVGYGTGSAGMAVQTLKRRTETFRVVAHRELITNKAAWPDVKVGDYFTVEEDGVQVADCPVTSVTEDTFTIAITKWASDEQ